MLAEIIDDKQVVEEITERTTIINWLLKRIGASTFDANQLYASEILAILLQTSKENRLKLGRADGIEALLKAVAVYIYWFETCNC